RLGPGRRAGRLRRVVGFPVNTPWTKRYLLGLVPIGDAFLVWSKTARPWVSAPPDPPHATVGWSWRLPLLMLLLVGGVVPWLPRLVHLIRPRSRSTMDRSAPRGASVGHPTLAGGDGQGTNLAGHA